MNHNMITPYHSHNAGYVSLLVENLHGLPEQIEVDGKTMSKKSEFHVSLMALKHFAPMLNPNDVVAAEEQLVRDFLDFQKTTDLSQFQPSNTFRLAKREARETVVMMVEVPHIEELFDFLRKKHGIDFPIQPTHITLYTLQPEVGIGILSQEELDKETVPIDLPALTNKWTLV